MTTIARDLNPDKTPREAFAIKAPYVINRVTFNPSSANPGETLYIDIPKLSKNKVIVPGTTFLRYDVKTTLGAANAADSFLVENAGRFMVKSMIVSFGSDKLQDTQRYDLFQGYHDVFLHEKLLKQGICSEALRKTRAGATSASGSNASAVGKAYGTKLYTPLDHPIVWNHGAFYPDGLNHHLKFELILADNGDIIKAMNKAKAFSFKLENIELEYGVIHSETLSSKALSSYKIGRVFQYENVLLHETLSITAASQEYINLNANVPRRSTTGILCLFDSYVGGDRVTSTFVNPNIVSFDITINGEPNRLYSKCLDTIDLWESMRKRFDTVDERTRKIFVDEEDFWSTKFGLWIDLRSFADNSLHGAGFKLDDAKDGIHLQRKRTVGGSNFKCYCFVVADAVMEVMNGTLMSIKY